MIFRSMQIVLSLIHISSYNLFSVLGIETKEVLICRVLADLLNPRGQHGMGSVYLELFLKEVLHWQAVNSDVVKHAVVTAEYLIDEDRRIDLVIETAGQFLPVEVKILACLLYTSPLMRQICSAA